MFPQSASSPRSPGLPGPVGDRSQAGLPAGLPSAVAALAQDGGISDAELVRRTLAGQHDPFAALVARYQKRAFWIAWHVVGSVEDARDVVQEAFVRLYRSLGKYDFARSFYTWFYRIVMNLAIDSLRKLRSARAGSLDEMLGGLADGRAVTGDVPLQQGEERGRVWAVLERLDAKFRAVLVLRDIHGLSCREIAPILKVTHATARWRLHRGRQMFKQHWERGLDGREQ
ncbi:MAG: sigma-70 family RNA polymerase sigma factor [Planctomycetota bacterium]